MKLIGAPLFFLIATSTSSHGSHAGLAAFIRSAEGSDTLSARLYDPLRERRARILLDADTGYDYETTLTCDALNCKSYLTNVIPILSQVDSEPVDCVVPKTGRLVLYRFGKEIDRLYISYNGECLTYRGQVFHVRQSLLRFLRDTPAVNW